MTKFDTCYKCYEEMTDAEKLYCRLGRYLSGYYDKETKKHYYKIE